MIVPRAALFCWLLAATAGAGASAATAPAAALPVKPAIHPKAVLTPLQEVERAARAQLERQAEAAGLSEPQFELAVVAARATPPCAGPVTVEALDTRNAARLRFALACPDAGGWRIEAVARAKISAQVAVAAAPIAAGQLLELADLALERRDVSNIPDSVANLEAVIGHASRRSLRAGEVLRSAQLALPALVKRGEAVRMVARHQQIEVSSAGEALDSGAQGALIRVRAAGGQVLRMRVNGAGTVEPLDLPGR